MTQKKSIIPEGRLPAIVAAGILVFAIFAFAFLGGIQRGKPRSGAQAQSEISVLSTALESYKVEYGDYPKATGPIGPKESANANVLYQALVVSNATYNRAGKVFFEPYKGICASTNYNSSTNYFVDPFGRPYQYRYPGDPNKSGTNFFDLFSYGKANKTDDNTNNWETWTKNW
jgi:hypothetical protein